MQSFDTKGILTDFTRPQRAALKVMLMPKTHMVPKLESSIAVMLNIMARVLN